MTTPYPAVNSILRELLESLQAILKKHLIGVYIEGSLANGDFDEDSDIDFVVVLDQEADENLFSALQSMDDRMALTDSPSAIQLEGSYLSREALRRYEPANSIHPNIER